MNRSTEMASSDRDMGEGLGGKHTSGPWEIYRHPISGAGDAVLELVEQVRATSPIGDTLFLINAGGKCPAVTGCGPTSEANARLIAASPELLEAAVEARRLCDQVRCDLASAHAEICKLQKLDPETHSWPEWTPQANTLRWLERLAPQLDAALNKARGQ